MKPAILIPLLLGVFFNWSFGQNDPLFLAPDTICQNEIIDIDYIGPDAESFCWVSSPIFGTSPVVKNIINGIDGQEYLFSDIVEDNGTLYIFISVSSPQNGGMGNLYRLDFEDGLNNPPTNSEFYPAIFPWGQEGVTIIKEDDQWWGFVLGFEYIIRLDFGNSLTNSFSVENLGNLGGLSFPHEIFIEEQNDLWTALLIDKNNNSLFRLNFGNSLGNPPTLELINNNELDSPNGLFPIQVEGDHFLFIVNEGNNKITRVDFGASILNPNPTFNHFNNLDFIAQPRDISIFNLCSQICGFVVNREDSKVIKLDFNNDITNTPNTIPLDEIDEFSFPHSISPGFVSEDGLYFFITSVLSNDLNALVFPFSESNFFGCQSEPTPPEISIDTFGIHPIFLITNQGTPSQSSFCEQILVLPEPYIELGNDTTICDGGTLILESNNQETIWQGQIEEKILEVNEPGTYNVEINDDFCFNRDTITIDFQDCSKCIDLPNAFTPNGDLVNDTFSPIKNCPLSLINFQLQIFNRWGQKVFETNELSFGWDGYVNGNTQPSGVYVWKLHYTFQKESKFITIDEVGDFTLIR